MAIVAQSITIRLLDSVAQVVGRWTQDQEVLRSNPDTGLVFKGCGESLK